MNAFDRSFERKEAVQKSAELLRDMRTASFPLDVHGLLSAFGQQIKLVPYAELGTNPQAKATDDKVQMSAAGNHVYSYDFSERFCVEDEGLLRAFQFDEETGINAAKATLQEFKRHLQYVTFDLPGVAAEYGIDPEKQKADMIATAKQVLTITESEIRSLSDELIEMYPVGYGVYYEECIRLIQKYVSRLA